MKHRKRIIRTQHGNANVKHNKRHDKDINLNDDKFTEISEIITIAETEVDVNHKYDDEVIIKPKNIICMKHPTYTGKSKPRNKCETCWEIYQIKHNLSDEEIDKLKNKSKKKSKKKKDK